MNDGTGFWTDERVDTLRVMWVRGDSGGMIAKAMGGISRNAVVGKAHRLGLSAMRPGRDRAKDQAMMERIVAAKRKPRKTAPTPEARGRADDGRMQGLEPVLTPSVADEARPWITRRFGECAWPVSGDGADVMSCCATVQAGMPYCPDHVARAYYPSKTSPKELARSVRRFL